MLFDLKFTLRLLLRYPGYALFAVVALAVGLGSATSVFTFYNGLLLRPLPDLRDESRLVVVHPFETASGDNLFEASFADFLDLREAVKTIDGLSIFQARTYILGEADRPERISGAWISAWAFDMLGARPQIGRVFRPDESNPGAAPVAVLSHTLWERRFGADPGIVGRTVVLNGIAAEIIGVMPPGFRFPSVTDLWMPFPVAGPEVADYLDRGVFGFPVYGRLAAGVTLDQAKAELGVVAARIAEQHPATNARVSYAAKPLRDDFAGDGRTMATLMQIAVILVLLIACANVANLLLAKATQRSREIAVRTALGATRTRIVRQILTESALLAAAGGVLGLLFAVWSRDILLTFTPEERPYWLRFEVDWRVLAFLAAGCVLACLLAGLFPAIQLLRGNLADELKDGGRGGASGRSSHGFRAALVIFQVALSLVVLIGAGLVTRTFANIQMRPTGLDADGVLTFRVGLPPILYPDPEDARRFFADAERELREIPGVESAAFSSFVPGRGAQEIRAIEIEGRPPPASIMEALATAVIEASPGFLETYGVGLGAGRNFTEDDDATRENVCLVTRTFADRYFPGEDPIGKRLRGFSPKAGEADAWHRIVGVVPDILLQRWNEDPMPVVIGALRQERMSFASGAVRVRGDPAAFGALVQQAVLRAKPGIPIYNVETLQRLIDLSVWDRQFNAIVFGFFAFISLFLSAIGIYSVVAQTVGQRRHEIGVRMALGARREAVVWMVGMQGGRLILAGMACGLVTALLVMQQLRAVLYGVDPTDPPTYFVLTILLGLVGLLACWLPARRASDVDPMVALRSE